MEVAILDSDRPVKFNMREGDILLSKSTDGYRLAKILRLTAFLDGSDTAHVLLYQAFPTRPSIDDVDRAQVAVWHAPIELAAMERDSEILGNRLVAAKELVGYFEYLKCTNFNAYLAEKGLSVEEVITQAQNAYDEGNRLCDQKKFEQAIVAYARAIESFPNFYEAHDNCAFALMDLGRFAEAAAAFEESSRVNPDNPVAVFSRGECFLKIDEFQKAAEIFQECVNRWPKEALHREFLQRAEALASAAAKKNKPWWRFW